MSRAALAPADAVDRRSLSIEVRDVSHHFDLAGTPGLPENIYQYGFWGSVTGVSQDLSTCGKNLPTLTGTETIASEMQYCPKYSALAAHVPE